MGGEHAGDLNPQERAFLDASLALRDREAAEWKPLGSGSWRRRRS